MRRRPAFARRLVARFALTVVAILAVLGFALDRTIERTLLDDLTDSLAAEARAVARALPDPDGDLQGEVRSLGRALGVRITVVRTDGVVLADSLRDPAEMENHGDREEIRESLAGGVGEASRLSTTVGRPFRYVAIPPDDALIVRLAVPLSVVRARLTSVRVVIVAGFTVAAALGVAVAYIVGRGLARPFRRMTASVERMAEGDLEATVPIDDTAEPALLAETLNRMAEELRRRIEQAGEDQQLRESILAAMEEGVVMIDGEQVAYANPSARRLLGGLPPGVGGLAPIGIRSALERARAEGRAVSTEVETGLPARVIAVTAVPVGSADRVLVVLRDVTEARRVEAMRRDFVADASHELKTPVASIQATAETAAEAFEDDPDRALDFLARLQREATRLSAIVTDLLDLSRLESERPEMESLSLAAVAGEVVERLGPRAADAGVDLRTALHDGQVEGSRDDLGLLIGNLLDNAIRATPRGGRIELRVERADEHIRLTVADTGEGIPTRDLPRVFERFYRVDRARSRATGGTGLGLAIARHVVEDHGGEISIESELGRGTTVTVLLPPA